MAVDSLPKELERMLQKDFSFAIHNRLHIAPEVKMYRDDDQSIWQQKKDEKYEYQVHWDGEFICNVSVHNSKETAYYLVLKGIFEKYREGKIHFNLAKYTEDEERHKQMMKDNAPKNPIQDTRSAEDKVLHAVFEKSMSKQKKSPLILPNGMLITDAKN